MGQSTLPLLATVTRPPPPNADLFVDETLDPRQYKVTSSNLRLIRELFLYVTTDLSIYEPVQLTDLFLTLHFIKSS